MRPDNGIQAPAVPFKRRLFSPPALISLAVALGLVALVATRFNPGLERHLEHHPVDGPMALRNRVLPLLSQLRLQRTSLADAGAQRPNRRRAGSTAALDR